MKLVDFLIAEELTVARTGLKEAWWKSHKQTIDKAKNEQERERLIMDAHNNFEPYWTQQREFIRQILADLKLEEKINFFVSKHPWLSKSLEETEHRNCSIKDTLIARFMTDLLRKTLLFYGMERPLLDTYKNLLQMNGFYVSSWDNVLPSEIEKGIPWNLKKANDAWPKRAQKQPYDPYYAARAYEETTVPFAPYLAEVNLLRLVFKRKLPETTRPMDKTEFQNAQKELNTLDTLILNITDDDDPHWVILHRESGEKAWNVYTDTPERTNEITALLKTKMLPIKQVHTVDLRMNLANSLQKSPLLRQLAFLNRVLRWLERGPQRPPLASCQQAIPADLLMLDFLQDALRQGEGANLTLRQSKEPSYDLVHESVLNAYSIDTKALINELEQGLLVLNQKTRELLIKPHGTSELESLSRNANYLMHRNQLTHLSGELVSTAEPQSYSHKLLRANPFITQYTPAPGMTAHEAAFPLFCAARNRFLSLRDSYFLNRVQQHAACLAELMIAAYTE